MYVMWNGIRSGLDCLLLHPFNCPTLNPHPSALRLLEPAQTSETKLRRSRCCKSETDQNGDRAARGVTQKSLPQRPATLNFRTDMCSLRPSLEYPRISVEIRPHSRPITTCVARSPRKNTVAFSVTDGLGPRFAVSVKLRRLSRPAPNIASASSRGLTSRNRR